MKPSCIVCGIEISKKKAKFCSPFCSEKHEKKAKRSPRSKEPRQCKQCGEGIGITTKRFCEECRAIRARASYAEHNRRKKENPPPKVDPFINVDLPRYASFFALIRKPSPRKVRRCITCGEEFNSMHSGHRVCNRHYSVFN